MSNLNIFLQQKKHLVTASYVDNSMSAYHEMAKDAGVTILCEMGLDPGIGKKCGFSWWWVCRRLKNVSE